MSDRENRGIAVMRGVAANDNPGPGPGQIGTDGGAEARIDAAVMTLARLIGRRIARGDHVVLLSWPEIEAHWQA